MSVGLLVATERLGWRGRRDEPSATCHLQPAEDQPALCGYPWESLTAIPGHPGWTELHPELRCDGCSKAVGVLGEDPTGRTYRYSWADRT
jgi:hypothetical protein